MPKFHLLLKVFTNYFKTNSKDENLARQEFILNILIGFSILCFSLLNIIRVIDVMGNSNDRGLPLIITLSILVFFIFLFWLSKIGWIKTASWLLIAIYSVPMIYSFWFWGADLPAALLLGVLIITFFGVLMGAKTAIMSAAILNIFLIILTYLQNSNIINTTNYWRLEKNEIADAITYAILFIIITSIVWLFDREMNIALTRARNSEDILKKERDSLEIMVEDRTDKIKEMEMDKIGQLYRFAELGRLSSGVFHDLINPLTAVSLNLEQIKNEDEKNLLNAKDCLTQAILASHKMEDLIACIKRSIRQENMHIDFSPKIEIESVIKILGYKARKAKTEINFQASEEINLHGDPVKFSQIIINLISNGIDACGNKDSQLQKNINIKLKRCNNKMIIEINDDGEGIKPENMLKIFKPFFSTKNGNGLGLGLSTTKNIIEKEFCGLIEVVSEPEQGTIFIITLPLSYAN